jgi:hypothetical protein
MTKARRKGVRESETSLTESRSPEANIIDGIEMAFLYSPVDLTDNDPRS